MTTIYCGKPANYLSWRAPRLDSGVALFADGAVMKTYGGGWRRVPRKERMSKKARLRLRELEREKMKEGA